MLKFKKYMIMCFIISILMLSFVEAKINPFNLPLMGKVIYIDPGHGGKDPGAIHKKIYESNINLEISKKLEKTLTELGAIVYMTRYGDYDLSVKNTINRKRSDLSRRSNIINRSNCDLFVSIHLNAESSNTWYGPQIFYDDINPENEKIAKILQQELNANVRGKRKYKLTNDMYLQKRVEKPGVLIEAGFISNPNERYLLQKDYYQEKLSKVIANGIVKYFEN